MKHFSISARSRIEIPGKILSCRSRSDIGKVGDGCANLLERSVLSISAFYSFAWKRDFIDYTELASKRWVDKWSMDKLADHFGVGRTAVIRHLGKIRSNPKLVADGEIRLRIQRRKNVFMGSA